MNELLCWTIKGEQRYSWINTLWHFEGSRSLRGMNLLKMTLLHGYISVAPPDPTKIIVWWRILCLTLLWIAPQIVLGYTWAKLLWYWYIFTGPLMQFCITKKRCIAHDIHVILDFPLITHAHTKHKNLHLLAQSLTDYRSSPIRKLSSHQKSSHSHSLFQLGCLTLEVRPMTRFKF